MPRLKIGLMLDPATDRLLDALSFVLGKSRSDLVTEGVDRHRKMLSDPQRQSVDTILRLAAERDQRVRP